MSTSKLYIDPAHVAAAEKDDWAKFVCARRHIESLTFLVDPPPFFFSSSYLISAFARIENHYFINDAFMRDGQLLDIQEIDKM